MASCASCAMGLARSSWCAPIWMPYPSSNRQACLGSAPNTAKDPIVLAARIILDLQTIVSRETNPTDPCVVTVGSIHGGTKHNIIPNDVHMQITVRSTKDSVRKHTLEAIERI